MDINHILSGLRCSAENQQHMALALSIQYLDTCTRADTGLLAPSNSTSQVDRVEFRIMSLHQFYFQKSCKRYIRTLKMKLVMKNTIILQKMQITTKKCTSR